jgi:hypothetical protein
MADIIIKVLDPADSYDLISLDEAKLMLGITDATSDEMISNQIATYSDVIATMCNRVFAKEKVSETWRCLQGNRIFLSHYPIAIETDIESIHCPRGTLLDPSGYEIELKSGKIELFGSVMTEPVVVTYTGGYDLPEQSPPALKQAMSMVIREQQKEEAAAATAGIKTLVHKESRVMFFDPNAGNKSTTRPTTTGGIPETVKNLLMHYVRLQV